MNEMAMPVWQMASIIGGGFAGLTVILAFLWKIARSMSRVEFTVEQLVEGQKQLVEVTSKQAATLSDQGTRLAVVETKIDARQQSADRQHQENLTGIWGQGEQVADVLKFLAEKSMDAAIAQAAAAPPREPKE